MTRRNGSAALGGAPRWASAGLCAMLNVAAARAQPATTLARDDEPGVEPGDGARDCPASACAPVRPSAAGDGVYGRLGGDLAVGIALGGEIEDEAYRAAARATVHYFWTSGAYASYRDELTGGGPDARLCSVGLDVRPLFLPRWSEQLEVGPALLDLVLDSASLSLGAFWANNGPEPGLSRGLELGLGLGFPLYAEASGPWLGARGLMRWPEPMLGQGRQASALVTLEWHWVVNSPLVGPE